MKSIGLLEGVTEEEIKQNFNLRKLGKHLEGEAHSEWIERCALYEKKYGLDSEISFTLEAISLAVEQVVMGRDDVSVKQATMDDIKNRLAVMTAVSPMKRNQAKEEKPFAKYITCFAVGFSSAIILLVVLKTYF